MKAYTIPSLFAGLTGIALAGAPMVIPTPEVDAFANAITPISNPTYHGNALPQTNIHGIYMYHAFPSEVSVLGGAKVPVGGSANIFAVQLEYAFNERLSFIATKDGYVDLDFDETVPDGDGFANLAAGLKYAFIYDPANQFVLSGSGVIEVPTGSSDIFQGYGDGAVNLVASALKLHEGWQFSGATGVHLPFDDDAESTTAFLSSHISYHLTEKFVPLVELNWFRVLSEGEGQGAALGPLLDFDGLDLINFGSSNGLENKDTVTLAAGARYKFTDRVNMGAAYELPLTDEENGLTDYRITVDLVWKF